MLGELHGVHRLHGECDLSPALGRLEDAGRPQRRLDLARDGAPGERARLGHRDERARIEQMRIDRVLVVGRRRGMARALGLPGLADAVLAVRSASVRTQSCGGSAPRGFRGLRLRRGLPDVGTALRRGPLRLLRRGSIGDDLAVAMGARRRGLGGRASRSSTARQRHCAQAAEREIAIRVRSE